MVEIAHIQALLKDINDDLCPRHERWCNLVFVGIVCSHRGNERTGQYVRFIQKRRLRSCACDDDVGTMGSLAQFGDGLKIETQPIGHVFGKALRFFIIDVPSKAVPNGTHIRDGLGLGFSLASTAANGNGRRVMSREVVSCERTGCCGAPQGYLNGVQYCEESAVCGIAQQDCPLYRRQPVGSGIGWEIAVQLERNDIGCAIDERSLGMEPAVSQRYVERRGRLRTPFSCGAKCVTDCVEILG